MKALILSGGGGKGAYQVGVYKALVELGEFETIDVISGCSIGALNAVLFSCRTPSEAEAIWQSVKAQDVLRINTKKVTQEIIKALFSLIPIANATSSIKYINGIKKIMRLLRTYGIFVQEGILRIIEKECDLEAVSKSRKKIYIACAKVGLIPEIVFFELNGKPPEEIKRIILASSAIPFVYETVVIDGSIYIDGGIFDEGNIPIKPAYENGCRSLICVSLDQGAVLDKDKIPGAVIWPIAPSKYIGGLLSGTLNFNQTNYLIESGYKDSMYIAGQVSIRKLIENRNELLSRI